MRFIKTLEKKESGAPQGSSYAYLVLVDDIKEWFPPDEKGILVKRFPVLKQFSHFYRLYTTRSSQKYSAETMGNHDERCFKQKFTATHPGRRVSALEFLKKYLDERFIIYIPECDGSTVILGNPDNPMVMVSSHESSNVGRKFTFDFEQQIGADEPYMIGDFIINENALTVDIENKLLWVLGTPENQPIIYRNNKLIQLHPQ